MAPALLHRHHTENGVCARIALFGYAEYVEELRVCRVSTSSVARYIFAQRLYSTLSLEPKLCKDISHRVEKEQANPETYLRLQCAGFMPYVTR